MGLGITNIISSDLKRASQTAEIINKILRVPLQVNSDLRECSFGDLEGMTRQQVIDEYGNSIISTWEDQSQKYDFRPYGGEHRDAVFKRYINVLKSALIDNTYREAPLLIGHGRGMITLLAGLGRPYKLKRGEYRTIIYPEYPTQ